MNHPLSTNGAVADEPALTSRRRWIESALDALERPLLGYVARLTGDGDLAHDIVQDAFLQLCRAERGQVEGHERAWLYQVCRHRAIDLHRKERRMDHFAVAVAERTADLGASVRAVAEQNAGYAELLSALGELPPNQKECIRLKFQDGLSYAEISEVTGLTTSNVGYLIHMGLKALRTRLADHAAPAAAH